uniref:TLC domain-containing protein n=1 Tax=viral metagenome TaxID=1070528 RepID=A0A6C0EGL8_9ZZZZ
MEKHNKIKSVILHDIFNVIVLSFISILNTAYLLLVIININKRITNLVFPVVIYSFIGYIIIDSLLIYNYPGCVVSKPRDLLLHHGITFIICLSPIIEPEFEWHAGLAITVEIQTIFLTLGRLIVDKTTKIYKFINTMFYALFIVFRLFIFPMLTVYYYKTHQKYSIKCNSQINIAITAVIGFSMITLMGFMWIYKFITKKYTTNIKTHVPFSAIDTENKTKLVKLSFTS